MRKYSKLKRMAACVVLIMRNAFMCEVLKLVPGTWGHPGRLYMHVHMKHEYLDARIHAAILAGSRTHTYVHMC